MFYSIIHFRSIEWWYLRAIILIFNIPDIQLDMILKSIHILLFGSLLSSHNFQFEKTSLLFSYTFHIHSHAFHTHSEIFNKIRHIGAKMHT